MASLPDSRLLTRTVHDRAMAYRPDAAAELQEPWITAFRSQRDLAIDIPINFVTQAGALLSQTCFASRQYEDQAVRRCLSNLLATGFRRFTVDLYWDIPRRLWSLCPVQIPSNSSVPIEANFTTAASATILSAQVTGSAVPSSQRAAARVVRHLLHQPVGARQNAASTGSSTSMSVSIGLLGPATSISTPTATLAAPPGETLFQIGPYRCTSSVNLLDITIVLADFFSKSSTNLEASLAFLLLNLHVAAPSHSPSSSPPNPSTQELPGSTDLLSNLLDYNLSSYIYTPAMLQQERADLDASWDAASSVAPPNSSYFNITTLAPGVHTTPDGWPSEAYTELRRAMRLVVGFGDVDEGMQAYNFTGDENTIFAAGTTNVQRSISQATNGSVTAGCFFRDDETNVAAANNSWAIASLPVLPQNGQTSSYRTNVTLPAVSDLTACGISPLLNQTLLSATADQNIEPYKVVAYSSLWNWAAGQPLVPVEASSDSGRKVRCALLDRSLNGRWRVADCAEHHRAACRIRGAPYSWRVSNTPASYRAAGDYCGGDANFSAPRTGLENRYLLSAFLHNEQQEGSDSDTSLWVNFNSLDMTNCWVVGISASCPYSSAADNNRQRTVIVPTVAAIIVFVLALLTLFVKCAANRQNSRKRRRKGDDGWDYEGVPS